MPISALLKYHGNKAAVKRFTSGKQTLGITDAGNATGLKSHRGEMGFRKKFCYKAGVPGATDTPMALYDLCEDITNGHWYLCTVRDPADVANTWTQIF